MSFAESSLAVAEGETSEVAIRYAVRELAEPMIVSLSVALSTATEDDFALSAGSVEIPAGTGTSGEVAVSVTANHDLLFAEGDETTALMLSFPESVTVERGSDLELVIREGGVAPCAGVRVEALPVSEVSRMGRRRQGDPLAGLATRLTVEHSEAATDAHLSFAGPYFLLRWWANEIARGQPMFAGGITEWRTEKREGLSVHELGIEWTSEWEPDYYEIDLIGDPDLRFRFTGGPCDGTAIATCRAGGCELSP